MPGKAMPAKKPADALSSRDAETLVKSSLGPLFAKLTELGDKSAGKGFLFPNGITTIEVSVTWPSQFSLKLSGPEKSADKQPQDEVVPGAPE